MPKNRDETEEEKRERRREKNRLSASHSRQQKREHTKSLEKQLVELEQKNKILLLDRQHLLQNQQKLLAEIDFLQALGGVNNVPPVEESQVAHFLGDAEIDSVLRSLDDIHDPRLLEDVPLTTFIAADSDIPNIGSPTLPADKLNALLSTLGTLCDELPKESYVDSNDPQETLKSMPEATALSALQANGFFSTSEFHTISRESSADPTQFIL